MMIGEEKEQIALRMMQKFGYRVGEGLGKQGQGIKTPLIVKKTNDVSGIIQPSVISIDKIISPEISAKNALCAHNIEVEKCIVVLGLDVDEANSQVVQQECERIGKILRSMIYV